MGRYKVLLVAACFLVGYADAGQSAPRQSYGRWQYNKAKNYYFRDYQYKVRAADKEYQHQYVVYYKDDPKISNKWVYFYNPQKEVYWGRYPTVNHDQYKKYAEKRQEAWSELPANYRQKDLYQIAPKSWGAVQTNYCPTVPGVEDGTTLLAPPADLP